MRGGTRNRSGLGHHEAHARGARGEMVEHGAGRNLELEVRRDVHDYFSCAFRRLVEASSDARASSRCSSRSMMRLESMLTACIIRSWSRLVAKPIEPHHWCVALS